jgi:pimeloyl-ACP methyl ester carboxylesterase
MKCPLALALLLLSCTVGCGDKCLTFASALVTPPNLQSPIRGTQAPPDELAGMRVRKQLNLNVGPPSAQLSVWVIDPIGEQVEFEYLKSFDERQVLRIKPATQPTLQSTTTPTSKGTLFILHGLMDRKEHAPYEIYAIYLARHGYRVVLADLRGHGRSTGHRISYGAHESRDMVQIADALAKENLLAGDIGVLGVSYGAAVAIQWAAIDPRVRAVVALEPFSSLRDASADAAPTILGHYRLLFSKRDIRKSIDLMGELADFDPDKQSPLASIKKCEIPIVLIHGGDDDFLKPAHSRRLRDANRKRTRLIIVKDGDHFDLWHKGMDTILAESMKLFDQHVAGHAGGRSSS